LSFVGGGRERGRGRGRGGEREGNFEMKRTGLFSSSP